MLNARLVLIMMKMIDDSHAIREHYKKFTMWVFVKKKVGLDRVGRDSTVQDFSQRPSFGTAHIFQ